MERIVKYLLSFFINIQEGKSDAPFVLLPSGEPCPGPECTLWKSSWATNDTVVGCFYATGEERHAYNVKVVGIALGVLLGSVLLYLAYLGFRLYLKWRIIKRALKGWAHFEW